MNVYVKTETTGLVYQLTEEQQNIMLSDSKVNDSLIYDLLGELFENTGIELPEGSFMRVADYELRDESEYRDTHGIASVAPASVVFEISGLRADDGIFLMMKHDAKASRAAFE